MTKKVELLHADADARKNVLQEAKDKIAEKNVQAVSSPHGSLFASETKRKVVRDSLFFTWGKKHGLSRKHRRVTLLPI